MSLDQVKPYAKAFVGALVAGLTAAATAIASDGISAEEWIGVAIAVLTVGSAVFSVPNRDPLGIKQRESVQPQSESYSGDSKLDATYHGQDN